MARFISKLLFTFFLSLLLQPPKIFSREYSRCELAWELQHVHNVPSYLVPTYVCIAKHASNYTTHTHNSKCYGIFRICEGWCELTTAGNCKILCSDLIDDSISEDINCAKVVYRGHLKQDKNGFSGWGNYYQACKTDVAKYVDGCF